MSRRTKLWIFAAAAALLGASPAAAQYGSTANYNAPPQWEAPIPLSWGDRDEGFYFSAEAAVMRINNALRGQVVAKRGFRDLDGTIRGNPLGGTVDVFDTANPPNYFATLFVERGPAGAVYGSQEVALDTDELHRDAFQPGTRISLGYRMRNGWTIEASYMGITKFRSAATAGIVPQNGGTGQDNDSSYLYSDFYNFSPYYAGPQREILSNVFLSTLPPGSAGGAVGIAPVPLDLRTFGAYATSAYGITNGFELVTITELLAMHTSELNLRVPVAQFEGTRTYWTGGLRYISTTERFRMVIEDHGFPDIAATANGNGTITDNEVRNEWSMRYTAKQKNIFYGLQTGVGGEAYLTNGFAISLDGKIGLLAEQSRSSVTVNRLDSDLGLLKRTYNSFTIAPMFQDGA
ncbi:MAG TPA: hypothetical protein PLX97_12865, partial [Gemmatales bacterium]|nr:hypothetical protein [Gemmatales bacterium]